MTDDTLAVHRTGRFGIVDADTFTRPGISPNARLVYVALTLYAGRSGEAWPKPATLAEQIGISRSTVYAALDELETAGIIIRTRRTTTNGADRPTVVTIVDPGRDSVRTPDTRSVRTPDTSVRTPDTRSVRTPDTNKNQENKTRARAEHAPAPTPSGRAVAGTDETRAVVDDTYRRRGLAVDHHAGATAARQALAATLHRERYP